MTPIKNGNRKWALVIVMAILLPVLSWVFIEVVYGGILDNKAGVEENKETIDAVDTNITKQLYEFRVILMRIETKQQGIEKSIQRIEKKIGE